ncbi:YafY family protein [Rufibacter sp. LB8]|nr:WYL domain-containing protein [Rufibacter sp. LB8]
MSKKGFISRYLLIIKKLKATPYVTLAELQRYVEREVAYLQHRDDTLQIGVSERTMVRDIKDIRNLFGVEIAYDKKEKGYALLQTEADDLNFQRMLEAFDLFSSLHGAQEGAPYVQVEKRRPQGTENLHGLLHAIKNRLLITFTYHKFWEDHVSQRTAEPYALKEFRNRWYVLARDQKDRRVKSFALDRLSNLQITSQVFRVTAPFNPEETYRHCFGIISPDHGQEPEEVILSLDPFQGKYVKTLPLHKSQQVLLDSEDELRIKLYLCVTHDFVMELKSLGAEVTVLQPASLQKELKQTYSEALANYQ